MNVNFLEGVEAPLRTPAFRNLWIANFLSNLGTIMHSVAAAWLMTSLTTSPLLIGLVQTAASLPAFLLGLPGGALADLVNRRRLLAFAQLWMMGAALLMTLVAGLGAMTPWRLLTLLFLLGVGAAIHLPCWQTLLQDLVSREHVASAVSLNSIGFNLARTVGPAIGGLLVAVIGAPLVFLANAISYLAVLTGLLRMPSGLVPESRGRATPRAVASSLVEGWHFTVRSPTLPGILIRAAAFMLGGSALWALLPVVARDHLHLTAGGYGGLLSAFGVGSVVGALFVPRLRGRGRWSIDGIVGSGMVLFSLCVLIIAHSHQLIWVVLSMTVSGAAWIGVVVNYNVSIQLSSPAWVRGRTISFYLLIFQGGLAIGSGVAGWLADRLGCSSSLTIGAVVVTAGLLLIPRFPLSSVGHESHHQQPPEPLS